MRRLRRFLTPCQGWGYSASAVNNFQLVLFHKYAELLQRRFSEDFQEVSRLSVGGWPETVTNSSRRSSPQTTTCP